MTLAYDPFALEYRIDPYPHYARLRAEAPVLWSGSSKTWVVSRHDDVTLVLRDPETFSSEAMASVLAVGPRHKQQRGPGPLLPGNIVTYDPPEHTRLRTIVGRAFTPRRVEAWRPMVESLTDEAIAKMTAAGRFDVIGDLAAQVPVRVIAEVLGIGAESHTDFKRWAETITVAMTGSKRDLDPAESGALQAGIELSAHLAKVVAERTAAPGDDVISVIIRAHEGDVLTAAEVMGFAGVLTFAGTETTTNLIGNAVRVLVEHPTVRGRVLADPDLVPALLEETLRWDSPVQYLFRRTTRATEIGGTPIPEDAVITILLGSANRDEAQWGEDAGAFVLDRAPSGHVGFGVGVHFCLGAALARMEAECALRRLLPLLEKATFAGHPMEPIDSVQFRGVGRIEFGIR